MAHKQHLRLGEAWIHAKLFEHLPGATAVTRPASVADVYAPEDPPWREVPQGEGQRRASSPCMAGPRRELCRGGHSAYASAMGIDILAVEGMGRVP
jgi:hypothetical protein